MSWATQAKAQLRKGEQVQIRPSGNSMVPLIHSGKLVTLEPVTDPTTLTKKDIVLVTVGRRDYLHLIKAVAPGPRFQIGNNKGHINGWVGPQAVYGKVVWIEP